MAWKCACVTLLLVLQPYCIVFPPVRPLLLSTPKIARITAANLTQPPADALAPLGRTVVPFKLHGGDKAGRAFPEKHHLLSLKVSFLSFFYCMSFQTHQVLMEWRLFEIWICSEFLPVIRIFLATFAPFYFWSYCSLATMECFKTTNMGNSCSAPSTHCLFISVRRGEQHHQPPRNFGIPDSIIFRLLISCGCREECVSSPCSAGSRPSLELPCKKKKKKNASTTILPKLVCLKTRSCLKSI